MFCIQIYQSLLLPIKKRGIQKKKIPHQDLMTSSLEIAMLIYCNREWSKIRGLIFFSNSSNNVSLCKSQWQLSKSTFLFTSKMFRTLTAQGRLKHLKLLWGTKKYSNLVSILAASWTSHAKFNAWSRAKVCCDLTLRSRISTNYIILKLTSQISMTSPDPEST